MQSLVSAIDAAIKFIDGLPQGDSFCTKPFGGRFPIVTEQQLVDEFDPLDSSIYRMAVQAGLSILPHREPTPEVTKPFHAVVNVRGYSQLPIFTCGLYVGPDRFVDAMEWRRRMLSLRMAANVHTIVGKHQAEQAGVDPNASMSAPDLARVFKLNPDALRKRLDRWRKQNGDGWTDVPNPKPNEAKVLYRVAAVQSVIDEMRCKLRPPKRPANVRRKK
jgi:hypothetical protein